MVDEQKIHKVLIVDDHTILREGLCQLINSTTGMTVCGTAKNAHEGFELIEKTKPDIVLVDISLPGKSGLELIKDIHTVYPDIAIFVLSMHEESLYAERVLRAGARGYLMKSEGGEKLIAALKKVIAGGISVSDHVANRILQGVSGKRRSLSISPIEALSDREFEVFQLIGKGYGSRQIAEQLSLSVKTVEAYRASIKQKLYLKSGPQLVHYAISWQQSQTSGVDTDTLSAKN